MSDKKTYDVKLTSTELATIRSCLYQECMKEDRAVKQGRKLGLRFRRITALLCSLPVPE